MDNQVNNKVWDKKLRMGAKTLINSNIDDKGQFKFVKIIS